MSPAKQPVLKPQDVLVTIALAVHEERRSFAELARRLFMSPSEVHAATRRAELSRLIVKEDGQPVVLRPSLQEFLLHGMKYAFPALIGPVTRGTPTGAGAGPLRQYFGGADVPGFVWPDIQGQARGPSLQPLYPSVPEAARADPELYEVLVLVDAVRAGAARERELASKELVSRLG